MHVHARYSYEYFVTLTKYGAQVLGHAQQNTVFVHKLGIKVKDWKRERERDPTLSPKTVKMVNAGTHLVLLSAIFNVSGCF